MLQRSHHTIDLMQEIYWGGEEQKTVSEWEHERETDRMAGRQNEREREGERVPVHVEP